MLVLLDVPLSPYAQKVKLALLEKGIPFEAKRLDMSREAASLRELNPRLEVPVLMDGDQAIFDSSVILEYLEDRFPEKPLLPSAPLDRARVRMLEELCDTAYDAVNWGVSELTTFARATSPLKETMLARARSQVEGLNARIERALGSADFLNGEQLGFGDIAVYPYVNAAAAQGNKPAADSPLARWLTRMRERPSTQRVKRDVVESLAQFADTPRRVRTGEARRQYRDHRLDWMMRSGGVEIVLEGIEANNLRFSTDL